ncbi:MAG: type III pantothenate kinase [bacterium]|nr:type III pantothenate kinase [bacterium]
MTRCLTIDGGNTTVTCRCDGDELVVASNPAARGEALVQLLAFAREQHADRAVAVTVVESVRELLAAATTDLAIPLAFAGEELPCPLGMDYRTPETLGNDRWVGALAAWHEFGPSVTVDCGSATTVNLVAAATDGAGGVFRGGAIAPGLLAFVAGMAERTPALPAADLDAEPVAGSAAATGVEVPARSTANAVTTGVLRGYAGLVERLVGDTLRSARGPATVVVTGGNAARLLRHSRLRARHVPDLVHRGLLRLATCGS